MLGGLRRVEPQPAVHVDAHATAQFGVGCDPLVQQRVQVLSGAFPPQNPGLVVDARAEEVDLVERHADQFAEIVHRPMHRVAHTGGLDLWRDARQVLDVHRHRVRVAEEPRVGRDGGHVRRDAVEHGKRAQGAEDATDSEGVTDGLAQAVLLGDVEIRGRRGVAADGDHVHHRVGTLQRAAAVERRTDGRSRAVSFRAQPRDLLGRGEAALVDVVKRELDLAQLRERKQVAHEIACELDRPGTDERHSEHVSITYRNRSQSSKFSA